MKTWTEKEKIEARAAITRVIRLKLLPPASERTCSQCNNPASEYHHYKGYDYENWLVVIPLCISCHGKVKGYSAIGLIPDLEGIKLSRCEIELLELLVQSEDIVTHKEIQHKIGGYTSPVPGEYSRPLVNRLRNKIGSEKIQTVHGMGYYLVP